MTEVTASPSSSSIDPGFEPAPPAADAGCYHCGETVGDERWQAELGGANRVFCCAGCQTVAETVHAGGLAQFYARRAALARPDADAGSAAEHALYDDPDMHRRFAREVGVDAVEATLMLENIRCAACVWLNEQHLTRQPGVLSVRINYATRRALVRWDPRRTRLSAILDAVSRIGYRAWPFEASDAAANARRERIALLLRLAVALFGMMQVMMYAWPVYWFEDEVAFDHVQLMRWASFILTVPVVLYSASPIILGAWHSLRNRRLGMDVPVAIGILAAFIASVIATVTQRGEVYFDSVTMFVAFLLGARYMELRARQQAGSGAEELARQVPVTCQKFLAWPGTETVSESVGRLRTGDVIRVRPGDVIPVDGVVVEGESHVEESLLTGESRPVPRAPGARVLAGSHNASSPLVVRVGQVGEGTRIAEIVRLLDRALLEKPRIAEIADRVAAWFIGALLLLTLLVGVIWWHVDAARAPFIMVAVLVVSCPCALSMATPAALAAASGALARRGLLVTRGHALETMAGVTDVMLDKTGTLTEGRFTIVRTGLVRTLDGGEAGLLALAAGLEAGSEHPIAQAIRRGAQAGGIEPVAVTALRNVPGSGVEGLVGGASAQAMGDFGHGSAGAAMGASAPLVGAVPGDVGRAGPVRIGHRGFAGAQGGAEASRNGDAVAADDGEDVSVTRVWVGDGAGLIGWIELGDVLRPDADALLRKLRGAGVTPHLVSGDHPQTVAWWARRLGIENFAGGVSPEGKREYVRGLQEKGLTVMAVGDGINDAPVLAQAQVSVAIGSGAPLAQAGADTILAHGRVGELADALRFSAKTRRVVRQNLGWSFAYNMVAIPAAAVGWVTPWVAGIGMALSSLLVVLNAWRLSRAPAQRNGG